MFSFPELFLSDGFFYCQTHVRLINFQKMPFVFSFIKLRSRIVPASAQKFENVAMHTPALN